MNRRLFLITLLMLTACENTAKSEVSYNCSDSVSETVKYSSAVVYGVDVPPPLVENVYPISEDTLVTISPKVSEGLHLIAINRSGEVFSRSCTTLCDVDDALQLVSDCRNTAGCQIVGGVKNYVFYPFYTSDRNGGHICKRGIR